MNVSTLFVENLQTSNIYNVNDIRTTQFSLNSLGTYVYNVLNSSTIQSIQSQFSNYANLNSSNLFQYLPQSNTIPILGNQLTNKSYVDNLIMSVMHETETSNHSWSGINTFNNSISLNNGMITNASTININSSRQIGYTYESNWSNYITLDSSMNTLETIIFDTPGVWQIHTQFEFSGDGIITQIISGYNNGTIYKEDSTIALDTNDVIQRFVPYVFVNQQGISTINIVSSCIINSGNINGRCKYFYVRIA
jgi:hypothetical protein